MPGGHPEKPMTPEIKLASLDDPGTALKAALLGFSRGITADIANLADDTVTRIHDIRVSTKKIRALLLLAGRRVPKAERKALFGVLREIRGAFAGSRDAEVMRDAIAKILPKRRAAAAIRKLRLEAKEAPVDTPAALMWASELESRLAALDFDGLKPRKILAAAADSYETARKLRKKCRKLDDDVLMHTWRKRVKEFCYHAMALADFKVMAKLVSGADKFAETLGEYHDLALLAAQAKDEAAILASVLEAKKEKGEKCLAHAGEVLSVPPRKFARKLASSI